MNRTISENVESKRIVSLLATVLLAITPACSEQEGQQRIEFEGSSESTSIDAKPTAGDASNDLVSSTDRDNDIRSTTNETSTEESENTPNDVDAPVESEKPADNAVDSRQVDAGPETLADPPDQLAESTDQRTEEPQELPRRWHIDKAIVNTVSAPFVDRDLFFGDPLYVKPSDGEQLLQLELRFRAIESDGNAVAERKKVSGWDNYTPDVPNGIGIRLFDMNSVKIAHGEATRNAVWVVSPSARLSITHNGRMLEAAKDPQHWFATEQTLVGNGAVGRFVGLVQTNKSVNLMAIFSVPSEWQLGDVSLVFSDTPDMRFDLQGNRAVYVNPEQLDMPTGGQPEELLNTDEFRGWTDSTGKFETRAKFRRVTDGKVGLLLENGKTIVVPLERLCEEDQAYVARVTAVRP